MQSHSIIAGQERFNRGCRVAGFRSLQHATNKSCGRRDIAGEPLNQMSPHFWRLSPNVARQELGLRGLNFTGRWVNFSWFAPYQRCPVSISEDFKQPISELYQWLFLDPCLGIYTSVASTMIEHEIVKIQNLKGLGSGLNMGQLPRGPSWKSSMNGYIMINYNDLTSRRRHGGGWRGSCPNGINSLISG